MQRIITPELLDELPVDDPRARKSRQDLQRVNWWMGNVGKMASWLKEGSRLGRLIELGAGDGTFALKLARQLAPQIGPIRIVLVDRLNLVSKATESKLADLGWTPEVVVADVFEWLPNCRAGEAIFANLFLHHFTESQLRNLFQSAAAKCNFFAACDPRRSAPALLGSHLLGLIGCNGITRHDAVISVRAGFIGNELSRLWPKSDDWQLVEKEIGMFSHGFIAQK